MSDRALAGLEAFPLDLLGAAWTEPGPGYVVEPSAQQYEFWEKSYAAVLGLGAAVEYALACGIPALAERIAGLAGQARTGLAAIDGVRVLDRGGLGGQSGLVTFAHERIDAEPIAAALRAAGVNVSVSPPPYAARDFAQYGTGEDGLARARVRVSPHAYNTEAEIDRMLDVVASATG